MPSNIKIAFEDFLSVLSQARRAFHNSEQWYGEGGYGEEETYQERLDKAEAKVRYEIEKILHVSED